MSSLTVKERYNTQMRLPGIGIAGQEKLKEARVLVVGAGGLGSVVLPYLAGAGVGTIGIADDDIVALDNLHRQVIYTMMDIGKPKAVQATERLKAINPGIAVNAYQARIVTENIDALLDGYHIVVDCTDNAMSRYVLNDACVKRNIPMVFGAVYGHEGQMAVLHVNQGEGHSANYRDIFPATESGSDMTCDDSGVFGTMTGIIGSMQGQEVLKLITGVGEPLINSLIYYDGLHNRFSRFEVRPSAKNSSLIPDHMIHTDDSDKGRAMDMPVELNPEVLHLYINSDEVTLLDIRDDYKRHTPVPFRHLHLPAADVTDRLQEITGKTVIVFCERGIQSLKVASRLKEIIGNDIQIYSLKHGISYWNRHFGGARITGT